MFITHYKNREPIKSFLLIPFLIPLFGSSVQAMDSQSETTLNDTKVHIVNVGKGQSLILAHGCSVSIIDAGGEMSNIDHYLQKLKLIMEKRSSKVLNSIIISHAHNDHLRYVKPIMRLGIRTKVLIGNSTLLKKKPYLYDSLNKSQSARWIPISVNTTKYRPLKYTIYSSDSCGKKELIVDLLWGKLKETDKERSDYYKRHEENNNSVVVGIRNLPIPILILGDANKPAQSIIMKYGKDILRNYKGAALVVGHHGYNNGVNKKFLKYLKPDSLYVSRTANHPLRKKTYKVLIQAANLQPATRSHMINVECKSDNPKVESLWGNLDKGIHDHGPGCPVITNRRLFMTSDQGDITLEFSSNNKLLVNTQY